jgi:uncharacterized membrane protein
MFWMILTIFITGLIVGFLFELSYKSIKNKKIIIPIWAGYPLYGFTALFLYLIYLLNLNPIIMSVLIIFFTTGIEFLIGFLYLKFTGRYPWNYKEQKWNYKGLICPLFSFFWLLISLTCYYLLLPQVLKIF